MALLQLRLVVEQIDMRRRRHSGTGRSRASPSARNAAARRACRPRQRSPRARAAKPVPPHRCPRAPIGRRTPARQQLTSQFEMDPSDLFLGQGFVQVQQRARKAPLGRVLDRIEFRIARRVAERQQIPRPLPARRDDSLATGRGLPAGFRSASLGRGRPAPCGRRSVDSRAGSARPPSQTRSASARAASMYVTSFSVASACSGVFVRVVLHRTRLPRGVVEEHRRPDDPPPEGVEAAAVERSPWSCAILLLSEGRFLPDAVRLIRLHRRPADSP